MAKHDALESLSKTRATKAGKALRDDLNEEIVLDDGDREAELEIVDAFRKAHGKSLARVSANLAYYVRDYRDQDVGTGRVVQRLKRSRTIIDKLTRHPTMALSTMQDIGGCRAVLPAEEASRPLQIDFANRSGVSGPPYFGPPLLS